MKQDKTSGAQNNDTVYLGRGDSFSDGGVYLCVQCVPRLLHKLRICFRKICIIRKTEKTFEHIYTEL